MIIKILICLGDGPRQIGPLADLAGNWAQQFVVPSRSPGKFGPQKIWVRQIYIHLYWIHTADDWEIYVS